MPSEFRDDEWCLQRQAAAQALAMSQCWRLFCLAPKRLVFVFHNQQSRVLLPRLTVVFQKFPTQRIYFNAEYLSHQWHKSVIIWHFYNKCLSFWIRSVPLVMSVSLVFSGLRDSILFKAKCSWSSQLSFALNHHVRFSDSPASLVLCACLACECFSCVGNPLASLTMVLRHLHSLL